MKVLSMIRGMRSKVKIKKILKSKWVIFGVGPILTLVGVVLVIWVGHTLTAHPLICLSCHARQTSISMWSPSINSSCPCHLCELSCESRSNVSP